MATTGAAARRAGVVARVGEAGDALEQDLELEERSLPFARRRARRTRPRAPAAARAGDPASARAARRRRRRSAGVGLRDLRFEATPDAASDSPSRKSSPTHDHGFSNYHAATAVDTLARFFWREPEQRRRHDQYRRHDAGRSRPPRLPDRSWRWPGSSDSVSDEVSEGGRHRAEHHRAAGLDDHSDASFRRPRRAGRAASR